jgi:hypothetical protein
VTYVRAVKTAAGATAVQIVHSSRRGSRDIDHLDSAHDDEELEALKAAARHRLAAGQASWIWGWMLWLVRVRWRSCRRGWVICGTRSVGPGSLGLLVAMRCSGNWCSRGSSSRPARQDSPRVLEEVGVGAASYPTLNRRLPVYAQESWRRGLAAG